MAALDDLSNTGSDTPVDAIDFVICSSQLSTCFSRLGDWPNARAAAALGLRWGEAGMNRVGGESWAIAVGQAALVAAQLEASLDADAKAIAHCRGGLEAMTGIGDAQPRALSLEVRLSTAQLLTTLGELLMRQNSPLEALASLAEAVQLIDDSGADPMTEEGCRRALITSLQALASAQLMQEEKVDSRRSLQRLIGLLRAARLESGEDDPRHLLASCLLFLAMLDAEEADTVGALVHLQEAWDLVQSLATTVPNDPSIAGLRGMVGPMLVDLLPQGDRRHEVERALAALA